MWGEKMTKYKCDKCGEKHENRKILKHRKLKKEV